MGTRANYRLPREKALSDLKGPATELVLYEVLGIRSDCVALEIGESLVHDGTVLQSHLHPQKLPSNLRKPPYIVASAESGRRSVWNPQTGTGIHVHFLQLEPSEASILEFASSFGLLGRGVTQLRDPGTDEWLVGEPIALWINHINKAKAIYRLLELALRRSKADIKEIETYMFRPCGRPDLNGGIVMWGNENRPYFCSMGIIVCQTAEPQLRVPTIPTVHDEARMLATAEINHELGLSVVPVVNLLDRGAVRLIATDLIGAVYLSMVDWFNGHKAEAPICEADGCRNPVPPERHHYCSDRCENKMAQRRRRARLKKGLVPGHGVGD